MQSKLPVRIRKKQNYTDQNTCCCAQLWKIMKENANDSCGISSTDSAYDTKKVRSKSVQTEIDEIFFEHDKKPYLEIKSLLVSINCTLEHILQVLQGKKEYLYNKLQEEISAPSKKPQTKIRTEKIKKKTSQLGRKPVYAWPEVSRFYFGQLPLLKPYMPKFVYESGPISSNMILCPRQRNWLCASRPFSCSDINYFQPMGRKLERPLGISACPYPIISIVGQGDLNYKNKNDIDDFENQNDPGDLCERELDKELQ